MQKVNTLKRPITNAKIWTLIFLGVCPNIILTFVFIVIAKAGHSPVAYMVGLMIPIIAFFCYTMLRKVQDEIEIDLKRIKQIAFKPSALIAVVLFTILLVLFLSFGAESPLEWFYILLVIEAIVIPPNLLFQFFIYRILKNHFFKKKELQDLS
jgi:hypothetical protein